MNINSLLNRTKRASKLEALKAVVNSTRASATLDSIPDQLSAVITAFDATDVQPEFRNDIHDVIATALTIAQSIADPAFDAQRAILAITEQQTILAKLLLYLTQRPERTGYSILIPSTRTLIGQFATEEEAGRQLLALEAFGNAKRAVVVPVRITSMFQVRPAAAQPQPQPEEASLPDVIHAMAEERGLALPDMPLGAAAADQDVTAWDKATRKEPKL